MRSICVRLSVTFGIAGAAMTPLAATGHITPADYRNVGVSVPENASIPRSIVVTDSAGNRHNLDDLISRPTVLVFADWIAANISSWRSALIRRTAQKKPGRCGVRTSKRDLSSIM